MALNLIHELAGKLTDFHARISRDVHISLLGYSEKMKRTQHYTLNGNTDINGEVKNIKFDEKKPFVTLEVSVKRGGIFVAVAYLV